MEKETFIFEKGLLEKADRTRKEFCKDEVHLRGIIEFSNHCVRNCVYCGLRRDNKNIARYRMTEGEIIALALEIINKGIKTIVLQSGDDFYYTQKSLCNIISKIKAKTDIAITLSIGERPLDDYQAFKDSGADRYLLKHETINPALYRIMHPGQDLKQRIKILEYLKKIGFQIGSGNIVGLPHQTVKDLACDALFLKDLDVDMAGIGPFIPQKDTPLRDQPAGDLDLCLKVLAMTRILTKNAHLPATTALASLDKEAGQLRALKSGANVIMPDFTPENYRKDYKIYDNKVEVRLEKAKQIISKAKRTISQGRGDSLKYEEDS
ncbi:MAG: [FeFe] hydrogenase H-cluster radical SAM maturase HydE [Candidatus Omnitrophota bacterium]|nr:[FeFe] hydrogenase H-cluster radical SAM maturase HydE [Candidatus Omnitrophota bacterium]